MPSQGGGRHRRWQQHPRCGRRAGARAGGALPAAAQAIPPIRTRVHGTRTAGVGRWRGVQLKPIQAGKPTQNAYVESFNARFPDECLNEHVFATWRTLGPSSPSGRTDYKRASARTDSRYLNAREFAARCRIILILSTQAHHVTTSNHTYLFSPPAANAQNSASNPGRNRITFYPDFANNP